MQKTIVIVEDNQIIAGVYRSKLQAELQKTFRADTPVTVSKLRSSLESYVTTPNDSVNLQNLYRRVKNPALFRNAEA
jgi:hypothetical protein